MTNPNRMFSSYAPAMPMNFPVDKPHSLDIFDGTPREQVMAIRDVLLNFPAIARMPINQLYRPVAGGGPQ
jgi:hypothetical protein